MKKLLLITPFILIAVSSCSTHNERNLLFSCNGVIYISRIEDSFNSAAKDNSVPIKISLHIGERVAELNGYKYEICQNSNTFISFGNCQFKDLVNYHSFDLATHKLYDYDYFSEPFRLKHGFPLHEESIRGEYSCEIVNNKGGL